MTLVEMLVVTAVIAILASLLLTVAMKSRQLMHASQCMSNERQIGLALQLYWENYGRLPNDTIADSLKSGLLPVVRDAGLFCCPAHRATAADSYSPWYVQRAGLQNSGEYVVGCFRHPAQAPVLYGDMHVAFGQPEKMLCNSVAVSPGASLAERCIDSGQMNFGDGSSVKIQKKKNGFQVEGLASFRRPNGALCSLVRLKGGEGKIKVDVTPGSGFEIVTLPLVARVRGTAFEVETEETADEYSAEVKVSSGRVEVCERREEGNRGRGQELAPGQSKKISKPKKK
ncbi:MAG: FecR domain-containing protein [Planctomycetota bacterium]|nr:FecR domain-containing protein [Planctomycetota bacterium]